MMMDLGWAIHHLEEIWPGCEMHLGWNRNSLCRNGITEFELISARNSTVSLPAGGRKESWDCFIVSETTTSASEFATCGWSLGNECILSKGWVYVASGKIYTPYRKHSLPGFKNVSSEMAAQILRSWRTALLSRRGRHLNDASMHPNPQNNLRRATDVSLKFPPWLAIKCCLYIVDFGEVDKIYLIKYLCGLAEPWKDLRGSWYHKLQVIVDIFRQVY